jgi:hypothetical protein
VATNLELAGKVARFVQLKTITLASATLKSTIDPLEIPDEIALSNRYRADYERKETSAGDSLYVDVDFGFEAAPGTDGEPNEPIVDLSATFRLVYVLGADASFEDEALEHFASMNGAYNAWPYWRELVQSVAGRVGLSGVVLPVFRPTVRDLEQEEDDSDRP